MDYKEVINKWKINKSEIARRISMPDGTFKNKISDNQTYGFTGIEEQLIIKNLRELANDIFSIDTSKVDSIKEISDFKINEVSITKGGKMEIGISDIKYSKTDKNLPGLTSGFKTVKSKQEPKKLSYFEQRQQSKLNK